MKKIILAALVVASLFASCSSEKTFRKKDGSHFTMTEDKKESTRLATNEERLMLFEEMFKYGIAFDKHDHRLIGKLVGV